MFKLLIVEDEPLVQVGIQSMINNAALDIEICGIAKDGIQALELLEKHCPQIVISDIKMPRMDGLQLIRESRKRYGKLPAFIILTSYEEFQFVKEAIRNQVIDYLIKLELDKDNLTAALQKAISIVEDELGQESNPGIDSVAAQFYDKFLIKLLFNLFENKEQISVQANELNIDLNYSTYAVSHCEILEYAPMWKAPDKEKLLNLYSSTLQMVRELTKKYLPCYVLSLDTKHFSIIFCLREDQDMEYKQIIQTVLEKTFSMVHNYYNVRILASIGSPCHDPLHISEAYQDSRQIFAAASTDQPILFYEDLYQEEPIRNIFNLALFKKDIKKAFEEFDTDTLSLIFLQITEVLKASQTHYLQAMDAACNILYLAISLLPDGEEITADIFCSNPDGYRSIYKQSNVDQIVNWLLYLSEGLCSCLKERKKVYKNLIINNVKKYIANHIDEKLTLTEVAAIFGISPNYLSNLFKKYNDSGFLDYITHLKIEKAKKLLLQDNLKIYEVAYQLSFENAFYFSKVFKKVTGRSPRDYIQNRPSSSTLFAEEEV